MKKIVVILFLCYFFTFSVSGADTFEQVASDKECQLIAGNIWTEKAKCYINQVDVINNVIFLRGYFTEKDKIAIEEMAADYDVVFTQRTDARDSTYSSRAYQFTADENYVSSNGMLFEMERAPYMKDGILMMPIRSFYDLYRNVTKLSCEIKWVGDDEQNIFMIFDGYGSMLSIKNNKILTYGPPIEIDKPINGKSEMIDGVVYVPVDVKNAGTIFGTFSRQNSWNSETNTLTLSF